MAELFIEIMNRSISAGWLILAVLMLRYLLRRSPKWISVLLWGMVGVRLVTPFSIESVVSLIPSTQTISPAIMLDQTPSVSTGIPVLNNVINPVITESFAPDPAASANPLQIWIPIAAAVWTAGMVLMLLYAVVSYWMLRRRVATAVRLRDGIYQSEFVDSPFVLGLVRPRIYIPFGKNEADFAPVIAHERAHISRKDHWWKPLGFLLLTVHWFHPLMWAAYILLCRDIEMACDERVIRELDGKARADYSQALLESSARRTPFAACPLAFGEVGVQERVKSVLNYKKPAFWIVILSVILCLVIGVCFLTDPVRPSLEVLPEVHSHTYITQAFVYENSSLHYTESADFYPDRYAISPNMELMAYVDAPNVSFNGWTTLGTMEETTLTRENFDSLFFENHYSGRPSLMRRENARAWRLAPGDEVLYILMQQNDGDLYLAYGDRNHGREPEPVIRWVYQLAIDVEGDYGLVARSGENAVPLTVFPVGTAIGNYSRAVHWLTIDPGEDVVPFRTYRDGEEFAGYYLVFDGDTYEELAYTVPSGLDPQTYIFQNADPNREYIVTMVTGEERSDLYCFGVRFGNSAENDQETLTFLELMVNVSGWVYVSTGEAVPVEIDPSAILGKIHTLVGADEEPSQNGQANFDCVGADYARLDRSIAVLLDGEWIRFEPKAHPKYCLTVGAEGVVTIQIGAGSRNASILNDDGEPFQYGEQIYLEPLNGLENLRGVTVAALDAYGEQLFSLRIADHDIQEDGSVICDDWVITMEE